LIALSSLFKVLLFAVSHPANTEFVRNEKIKVAAIKTNFLFISALLLNIYIYINKENYKKIYKNFNKIMLILFNLA